MKECYKIVRYKDEMHLPWQVLLFFFAFPQRFCLPRISIFQVIFAARVAAVNVIVNNVTWRYLALANSPPHISNAPMRENCPVLVPSTLCDALPCAHTSISNRRAYERRVHDRFLTSLSMCDADFHVISSKPNPSTHIHVAVLYYKPLFENERAQIWSMLGGLTTAEETS